MKKTSAYINDPAKYCHVPKLICLLDYHGQHSQSDALKPYPSEIHLSTWQRIRLFYRLNSFKSIVWGFLLLLFLFCFPSSRLPVFFIPIHHSWRTENTNKRHGNHCEISMVILVVYMLQGNCSVHLGLQVEVAHLGPAWHRLKGTSENSISVFFERKNGLAKCWCLTH